MHKCPLNFAKGRKRKCIDNSFELFEETTTFHGVRDFFVAQSWGLKMLWLITVIVAVIFAAHGSYSIFSEYSARPVVVSYFVQDAGSLPLPDILICPFNRYNRTFLEMHNVSESLAQYLEMSYPGTVIHQFQAQKYSIIKKQAAKLDDDLQQLLMRLGNITFKEFVEMAALDCTAFFEDKSVCKTVTAAMSSVGKCFRVYGGDQQGNGYGNGKRLVLKVPTHLYHAGVNNMINDGLAVKLAERSRGADRDLTFIPTGVHALMPLSATRYEFMSDPPRYMCLEKADDNYSNLWCFEVCLTQIPEDKCNCSLAASTIMRKDAICTYKQFVDCFMPTIRANGPARIMKKCKNKCKAPCSYWSYQKTISYARFPAHHHRSLIDNDTEWEELHNRIILEVFYTSLDHTVIKHLIAMTPSSFIAQIGGQLSLWIGGSIISILQLVIYFFRGTIHYSLNKFHRKGINSNGTKSVSLTNNHNNNRNSINHLETSRHESLSSHDYTLEGESVIL